MKLFTYHRETDTVEIIWEPQTQREVRSCSEFDLYENPEGKCIGVKMDLVSDIVEEAATIHDLFDSIKKEAEDVPRWVLYALIYLGNLIHMSNAFFGKGSPYGFIIENWSDDECPQIPLKTDWVVRDEQQ